ncbi:hypothetical protein NLJ89_g4081 [Agrocybe chaxingu]|uniref:Uncharacterized protein n=1 Tax=Agrocybe chaxingu TaxID=84603 RepID=A0A9W8K957_9AGAR|nr:hypothetical protein NLJ89_g4081 [Agrocybe chaxingu]
MQDKLKALKVIAIPRSFLVPDRLSPVTGASLTVSYTEFRGTGPPTVTKLLGNPGDIYIYLHDESPKLYCKVSLTAWVEWSGPLSGLGAGIRHPTFSDYTLQCGVGSATEIEWVPNSVAEQKCTLGELDQGNLHMPLSLVEGSSRENVARVLRVRSARVVVTTVPKKRRQKITPASSKRRKLVDAGHQALQSGSSSCKLRGIPVNAKPVSEPSSQPNMFSEFPLSTTFASALNSGHTWNPVEPPPPRRLTAINLPTSLDEQLSTDPPPVDPTEKHAETRPEEKMQVDTPIGPLGQDGFNADEQATEGPSSGERVEPPLQDVTNTLESCSALLSSSVGCPSLQDSASSGPQHTESGQDVVLEDRTSTLSHPPAIILNQQTVTEYPSAAPKDESIVTTAPLDESHPASHTVNSVLEQAAVHEFAKVESVENRPHIKGIDSNTQAAKISTFEGPYEMISQDSDPNTVRSDLTPALATAVNVSSVADVPASTERYCFYIDPIRPPTEVQLCPSGKDVLAEASSSQLQTYRSWKQPNLVHQRP